MSVPFSQYSQEEAECAALERYMAERGTVEPLPALGPEENASFYGARIQRSMALLATSTPGRRRPVRVLIYGQSISGSYLLTDGLRLLFENRFPNALLTLENRSIGGFSADCLVRTAVHDLYPAQPDLLIFHVYGGEASGELERIVSNVRRYTTSDILLFNHHQSARQTVPDEESVAFWRYLAQKYDCELCDVSREWHRYLADNGLSPSRLLRDGIHLNREGNELLVELIGRHLRYNPLFPGVWQSSARTYEARRALDEGALDEITFTGAGWRNDPSGFAVGDDTDSALHLRFEGSRVDVIAPPSGWGDARSGTARVLIDGRPPSENPRLYAITRPSAGYRTWFPAIRRISHEAPLLVEDWRLRVTEVNADASQYRFVVEGSVTGYDGCGGSDDTRWVSRSGRVVIEKRDVLFETIGRSFKAEMPVGFEVCWSVAPRFADVYQSPRCADTSHVVRTTLAHGLSAGMHTLDIIPNRDGSVAIESIDVHRPPLMR